MPRDYRLYLDDILESIGRIREYVQDMEESDFESEQKTQDAVIRNLEIIGEAARNLPDSMKDEAGEIEWRKIIGLRNILAHEYFGTSVPIVWDVIQNKLIPLERACTMLLNKLGKG
jgi:uncharacterized protein with HEPN domain